MLEVVTECFRLVSDWFADHLPKVKTWVTKLVTNCFIPLWDWVNDQLPKVQEWVTNHPYATVAIVIVLILITVLAIKEETVLFFLVFAIKQAAGGAFAAFLRSWFSTNFGWY
ncbi:hypothetical protein EDC04DRAFT_2839897 [Pisolithus marmoratus]|nr:hypothetical protein EDC04DRAFT_2839897 [Pisolithus marmoratus]